MSIRTERVAELIQREMSAVFQKELPRSGVLTTIMAVKITPDLSIARIYLSILGSKEMSLSMMAHIQKEAKFFRKEMAARIRNQFRRIPEIEFYLDDLAERAAKMDELIRAANPPAPDAKEDEADTSEPKNTSE